MNFSLTCIARDGFLRSQVIANGALIHLVSRNTCPFLCSKQDQRVLGLDSKPEQLSDAREILLSLDSEKITDVSCPKNYT